MKAVGIAGLVALAGWGVFKIANEEFEGRRSDKAWAKYKRIWERSYPDLPYWPTDVPPEKQSRWLATRQQWETKFPKQGHLPWQGRLGIRDQ